jgi:hypothetical protein
MMIMSRVNCSYKPFLPVAFALIAPLALAQVTIDDFEDNAKDPFLWGVDEGGTTELNETEGRLQFVNANFFGEVEVARPFATPLPAGTDWTVIVEVTNTTLTQNFSQVTSIGVALFPSGERTREVFLELYSSWTGSDAVWGYNAQLVKAADPDGYFGDDSGNEITSSSGQLRLSYNATSQVVKAEYWPEGEPAWIELATFGINGSGGSTANADWGITSSGRFDLNLFGYANAKAVNLNELYFEQFSVEGFEVDGGPPLVANDDTVTLRNTVESYVIEVLVNDRGLTGTPEGITLIAVGPSEIGAEVEISGDTVVYRPPTGYLGTDRVPYTIRDAEENEESADILIKLIEIEYPGTDTEKGIVAATESHAATSPAYPGWITLYELYLKHIAEILSLTLQEPEAGSPSAAYWPQLESSALTRQGTPESEQLLNDFVDMATEAAVAVFTGEADTVMVSQEMAETTVALRYFLEENGSDQLKADLEARVAIAKPLEDYVGQSLSEVVKAGAEPIAVDAFAPSVGPDNRLSVRSWNLPGVIHKLWRLPLDGVSAGTLVDTQTTVAGDTVILEEASVTGGSRLYQVRVEPEN